MGGWASPPSPRSGGGGGARSLGEAPPAAGPHPRPLRAAPETPLQTRGTGCGKAAATASERITYPSLLRGTGRGGAGRAASRESFASVLLHPVVVAGRALGPSALLGNNVIPHTLRT
ncbi:unnamed protein product [Rangifer tarandus platyrhynchus]|uniref:Uncharacterized protein n=1 Tax=Rangifer tarandus platyrhynchus TaxID=3082113 RepID=A0ABN9A045_RANTA|nr:unnamed protein product [Rangifer tarandus platyrhynchus]